jgi:hypothetical protein
VIAAIDDPQVLEEILRHLGAGHGPLLGWPRPSTPAKRLRQNLPERKDFGPLHQTTCQTTKFILQSYMINTISHCNHTFARA